MELEFFSNKYSYYFICLIADFIYLIWLMWYMFYPKKILQKIVIFILVYIFLTLALTIFYFYLGDSYPKELGLNTSNSAQWSRYDLISIFSGVGVFLAPIAVLFGFNIWKEQQFESSKIKAIESIKSILSDQESITWKFRLNANASLIKDGKFKEFDQREKEWSDSFEALRHNIMSVLINSGFYFEKSILDNLYKLNNETIKLITELESTSFLLKGCWFGSGKIQPEEGEPNDQNILILKRIYLIEPTYLGIKYQLKRNNELKLMCEEFEKDRVLDPLTNYFNYLNKILEESYKS